jgi:hypothetical protein
VRILLAALAPVLASAQAHSSCTFEVGARQANLYVTHCREVSPATRPPCNVANACALIISEIRRGCELLKNDAPAYCAQYAQSEAYVGKWASKPDQCQVDQSLENAPLMMARRRFDQYETHCEFASVQPERASWRVQARCSLQGDRTTLRFTLAVEGDRLTIRHVNGGATVYQRCS